MAVVRKRDDAAVAARFPAVGGRSLLGVEMALPSDFPAELTLAVVAFQRWQQDRVDRWIARAVGAGIPPTTRGATGLVPVAVVEVPVLGTGWRPARRFIDGGMTAGIGDPDVLARTITVYTDVAAFQRSLAIPGSDDVHAFVVRRDGAVLARGHGDPDDEQWEATISVLTAPIANSPLEPPQGSGSWTRGSRSHCSATEPEAVRNLALVRNQRPASRGLHSVRARR